MHGAFYSQKARNGERGNRDDCVRSNYRFLFCESARPPFEMFTETSVQIIRGADVEAVRRFAPENVEPSQCQNGRPVGTRTPDLYRVKVAL